ncbi:UNVERIFIED_CONTAM: hypothetical protein GTU68_058951 [Idotea baltica]|nr:hypothetical protein [Idotea baltica]
MLVLLIVFMITAPMLVRGEDVSLPKTKSGPLATTQNGPPLSVTVRSDGNVVIQNTQIPLDELGAKLTAILQEGYEEQIFIRADENVPYGRVMEVTAEVRAVGYTRLAFVTEQKQ